MTQGQLIVTINLIAPNNSGFHSETSFKSLPLRECEDLVRQIKALLGESIDVDSQPFDDGLLLEQSQEEFWQF